MEPRTIAAAVVADMNTSMHTAIMAADVVQRMRAVAVLRPNCRSKVLVAAVVTKDLINVSSGVINRDVFTERNSQIPNTLSLLPKNEKGRISSIRPFSSVHPAQKVLLFRSNIAGLFFL